MVSFTTENDARILARRVWLLVGVFATTVAVAYLAAGLRPDLSSNPALLATIAAYAGVAAFYRTVRADPRLYASLEAAGQMLLVLLLGLMLTYAAACSPLPARDALFDALDHAAGHAMGLDRRAYFAAIVDSDVLRKLSGYVYLTIQPQIVLVPFALIVAGHVRRLQTFTLAFGMALMTTIAIAALLPSSALYVFEDLRAAGFDTSGSHFATYEALRSGAQHGVALNKFEGLITFPSFHAASGVLFTWALWVVRPLRWPLLAVNAAMVMVAPIHGPHYFVDIPAGLAIAAAAILVARRLAQVHAATPAALPQAPAPQPSRA
jgi:hypothetical protein